MGPSTVRLNLAPLGITNLQFDAALVCDARHRSRLLRDIRDTVLIYLNTHRVVAEQ
jgi:hypothetical protein